MPVEKNKNLIAASSWRVVITVCVVFTLFSGCKDRKEKDRIEEQPPHEVFSQTEAPDELQRPSKKVPGPPRPAERPGEHEPRPPAAEGEVEETLEINEELIDKYLKAHKKVLELEEEYRKELSGVQDADRAKELQKVAGANIRSAVKKAGLEFDTFAAITIQMQKDPELRQEIEKRLKKDSD